MKESASAKKIKNAKVIDGAGRGRKIGIPTVNFDPTSAQGFKEGIYVCRVIFKSYQFWGVLHYGPRPVFNEIKNSLEAHLFEFDDNKDSLKQADIEIYDFIRKVANFKDKDALVARINKDISFAKRKILSLES